jgi:hypothetical protein
LKTNIGTAYVQILPTTDGITGQLTSALKGPMDQVGRSAGTTLGGALKGGLITAAKAGVVVAKASIAGIAVASAGVAAITKQAVDSYADYEQLVGGVETLFKDSADQVMQYAADAYKTAGLSANQYMETVTSFSASLLQSLGGDTKAAAEMADLAITDMADNANKMGSDMASIQNAYQGFAKQNYTMLDNLKLGYGGTQEEMYRLMSDAAALNEEFAKTAVFSLDEKGHLTAGYADIVRAIHIVQTEMGITGTTAEEASKTISGSLGMLKASWQNLLTGMADPAADMDALISNLVDSAGTAAENLLPVVERALSGIGELVARLAPIISERLPTLIQQVLPPMISAATEIVVGLAKALPQIITVLLEQLPTIVSEIGHGLMEAGPALAEAATNMIHQLSDFLVESMPQMAEAIKTIVVGIVKFIINNLPAIAQAALAIVGALAMGMIELVAELVKAGWELVKAVAQGIGEGIGHIVDRVTEIGARIRDGFFNLINRAKEWGWDLIANFIQGIKDKAKELWDTIKGIAGGVKDFLGFSEPRLGPLSDFHTFAPDMMELFARGIRENKHLITDEFRDGLALDAVVRGTAVAQAPRFAGEQPRQESRGNQTQTGARDMTVILELDRMQLGRAVYRLNESETQRVGLKLAGGYA